MSARHRAHQRSIKSLKTVTLKLSIDLWYVLPRWPSSRPASGICRRPRGARRRRCGRWSSPRGSSPRDRDPPWNDLAFPPAHTSHRPCTHTIPPSAGSRAMPSWTWNSSTPSGGLSPGPAASSGTQYGVLRDAALSGDGGMHSPSDSDVRGVLSFDAMTTSRSRERRSTRGGMSPTMSRALSCVVCVFAFLVLG